MATFDFTQGGATGGFPAHHSPVFAVTRVLDFSSDAMVALNSGTGAAQNDVIQLIHVPANAVVIGVFYRVIDFSSNLADLDIGDGSDPDGWHDGINMTNGTDDWTGLTVGAEAYGVAGAKFYSATDTVDAVVKTAASIVTGKISVTAIMIRADGTV